MTGPTTRRLRTVSSPRRESATTTASMNAAGNARTATRRGSDALTT
jgi:hypothetical protein